MSLFSLGNISHKGFTINTDSVIINGEEFKRFSLSDKEWYYNMFKNHTYEKLSWDCSFAHLHSIRFIEESEGDLVFYRIIDGHVCVFYYTHSENNSCLYFTPIKLDGSESNKEEMSDVLMEVIRLLSIISGDGFSIMNGMDPVVVKNTFVIKNLHSCKTRYPDFVFRSDDIIKLEGKKYQKRRNMYNAFKRNYPTALVRDYEDKDFDGVMVARKKWEEHYNSVNKDSVWDVGILENLIRERKELGIVVKVATIEDVVVAVAVVDSLSDNCFSFVIRSQDPSYRGLSEYLWYESTRQVRHLGEYFNDGNGGDNKKVGLYQYKNSHNPVFISDKRHVIVNKKGSEIDYESIKRL